MTVDPSPHVTMIRTPACHFCHEAGETLGALALAGAIRLTIMESSSAEAQALIAHHRPALAPLVLLDEQFFSSGRLPKRKLARTLGELRMAGARS